MQEHEVGVEHHVAGVLVLEHVVEFCVMPVQMRLNLRPSAQNLEK